MITLDLNIDNKMQKVKIKDEILFNSLLVEHKELIISLIKVMCPSYDLHDAFFDIVNKFVDFTKEGISLYPGLIVRTSLNDYAVLYLEGIDIDEEYMISLINEYIHDIGDYDPKEININKFKNKKKTFLKTLKNI